MPYQYVYISLLVGSLIPCRRVNIYQDPSTAPEREWVESSRHVGIRKPDAARLATEVHKGALQGNRYPAGHPLEWLNEEPPMSNMSDEHRQEIIRLGFPDDGYDYLQHMRQGHSSSGMTLSTQDNALGQAQPEEEHGGENCSLNFNLGIALQGYDRMMAVGRRILD